MPYVPTSAQQWQHHGSMRPVRLYGTLSCLRLCRLPVDTTFLADMARVDETYQHVLHNRRPCGLTGGISQGHGVGARLILYHFATLRSTARCKPDIFVLLLLAGFLCFGYDFIWRLWRLLLLLAFWSLRRRRSRPSLLASQC